MTENPVEQCQHLLQKMDFNACGFAHEMADVLGQCPAAIADARPGCSHSLQLSKIIDTLEDSGILNENQAAEYRKKISESQKELLTLDLHTALISIGEWHETHEQQQRAQEIIIAGRRLLVQNLLDDIALS